jgi:polyhydroxyalkanoate synthesis regulator phasin
MIGGRVLDEFRRLALFTSGVAELTRNRAEQLVKDMMKEGELRRDRASSLVKDLVERSQQNRRELMRVVQSEVRNQMANLGVVTRRDLERLERRVTRLEGSSKKTTRRRASPKTSTRKAKGSAARSSGSSPKTPAGRTTDAKPGPRPRGASGNSS